MKLNGKSHFLPVATKEEREREERERERERERKERKRKKGPKIKPPVSGKLRG